MLIVTHDTIRNPSVLKVRQLPRKFFGRATVWPRGMGPGLFLRIIVEFQILRYFLTLTPLVVVALIWNGAALPLSQAPVLMLILIWWLETRVLRVPASRRARLIDPAAADRGLDALRAQARAALTRIAAHRGLKQGELHLVIEQSDLWTASPLTYVSVQWDKGPEVLSLTPTEMQILRDGLFQGDLSERRLQRINQSQNQFLRDITFDARGVSAHARLAAALG
ncbi:hypothetical protein LGQ03_16370 [Loktanella sp. TSTF-M6]|uniref:Uncharacterized protein n=1 Tax=Loktanella gaetbuli TaxID=2881335 RepID=A0ABS8BYP3_9RHOB|nr:hypothetical protein [Loktanella gaetbuli]MCB5200814.1 hypothetical protein [Loktanella gaetbuli]